MKYRDLGTSEAGVPRREYVGYMTDAEYVAAILGAASDLDDGAREDNFATNMQYDLWDELYGSVSQLAGMQRTHEQEAEEMVKYE